MPALQAVKRFLAAHRVPYENVDIDEHPEAIDTLKELQGGGQIIPTVVYGDGSHEVNPSDEALAQRIGLTMEAERAGCWPGRTCRRRPSCRNGCGPTRSSSSTGVDIAKLEGKRGRFPAVVAKDRESGGEHRFPAAAAFVFIGLTPNSGFLGDAVARDDAGFLVTSATKPPPWPTRPADRPRPGSGICAWSRARSPEGDRAAPSDREVRVA